jgi:hypothetical protein
MFKKLTFQKREAPFNGHNVPVAKVIYGDTDITILAAKHCELPLFPVSGEWYMCAIHSNAELKRFLDPFLTSREIRNIPIDEVVMQGDK